MREVLRALCFALAAVVSLAVFAQGCSRTSAAPKKEPITIDGHLGVGAGTGVRNDR